MMKNLFNWLSSWATTLRIRFFERETWRILTKKNFDEDDFTQVSPPRSYTLEEFLASEKFPGYEGVYPPIIFTEDNLPGGRMKTWIVIDALKQSHKVTADYIAQPVENGYINFVRRGEANSGITDCFYHPISVREVEDE